jgi:hypothetical protein
MTTYLKYLGNFRFFNFLKKFREVLNFLKKKLKKIWATIDFSKQKKINNNLGNFAFLF